MHKSQIPIDQLTFACSKSTIETFEKGVNVQSYNPFQAKPSLYVLVQCQQ